MGIMIAGVSSGAGKTTLTIGLMRALTQRGMKVAGFKSGPDYIDPMFHRLATRESSYNLPTWMVPDDALRYLYQKRSEQYDISVIEGVMGYYDGHSTDNIIGSSAHLAKVLDVPVMVVMDGSSMALTAAAIVKGLISFETPTQIKGVIFNRIKSAHHYNLLKSAVETHTNIKCYGYIKPDQSIELESRHLGLVQACEDSTIETKIEKMSNLIEATVDVDSIISDFTNKTHVVETKFQFYEDKIKELSNLIKKNNGLTLGVAKDLAFSFYYDENLKLLEEIGVKIVCYSPVKDAKLPDGIDGVLLGGGYPELFAKEIEANIQMKESLYKFALNGGSVYAECGGLMYLTDHLEYNDCSYKMTGILGGRAIMTKSLQNFGHVEAIFKDFHTFADDVNIRGHEFHHSYVEMKDDVKTMITLKGKKGIHLCGYMKNNTMGTYLHTHFYSNLNFVDYLMQFFLKGKI
ncbi:cobyrinate a,c-diamide synthase [Fusibacter bizertensis]|uniref:Cobyrinate a,c-diamide synthase n=1 Tax=Fusibacter bizertensis TaxID=1488331 RepID=A0ABT6NFD9_9FIRM|nr:cobyrinate a,c-diamide synthase [Fusibacter bizertensis]MDH8679147.1 cobyrinate a,c-diamide synthase [Fusibacter bizertensis]